MIFILLYNMSRYFSIVNDIFAFLGIKESACRMNFKRNGIQRGRWINHFFSALALRLRLVRVWIFCDLRKNYEKTTETHQFILHNSIHLIGSNAGRILSTGSQPCGYPDNTAKSKCGREYKQSKNRKGFFYGCRTESYLGLCVLRKISTE